MSGKNGLAAEWASRTGGGWQGDPAKVLIRGIDTKDGPEHKLWDRRVLLPESSLEDLALSLEQEGQLQNVLCYIDGSDLKTDEDRVVLLVGTRRTRAMRLVNKYRATRKDWPGYGQKPMTLAFRLVKGTEKELYRIMCVENARREDEEVLDQTEKMHRGMKLHGMTIEEIVETFGPKTLTPATVKNRLKLMDLAEEVRQGVREGKIDWSAAIQFADLERSLQVKEYLGLVDRKAQEHMVRFAPGQKIGPVQSTASDTVAHGVAALLEYVDKAAPKEEKPAKAKKAAKTKVAPKITAREVKEKVREVKAEARGEEPIPMPTKKQLMKLREDTGVDERDRKVIGFCLGLVPAKSLKGFLEALRK